MTKAPYSTSRWTIAEAMKVRFDDPTTTMPSIDYNFPVIAPKLWQWDSWALRDLEGRTITYKGWYVLFSLVVPRALTGETLEGWNARHGHARIGYFFSRTGNGSDWQYGGHLVKDSAMISPQEWSGGSVMREGSEDIVDLFYTAVNFDQKAGAAVKSVTAHSEGRIRADEKGVWFEGFDRCTEMFAPDGMYYTNYTQDPEFDFRDPHIIRNPGDGMIYALFEGNVAGLRGHFTIGDKETGFLPPATTIPASAQYGAAAIGIARLLSDYTAGDFSQWEMLPPLVTALGVNDQTERPHAVFKDGLTYLFTDSHTGTYTGNSTGPDGLYGFLSRNGLFGPYVPLNGSALVLGTPSSAPNLNYAHFIDPDGYVQSFIDTIPKPGTPDPKHPTNYRIGGTLAPTVKVVLDDDRTYITEVHSYGQIYAQREWPVSSVWDKRPASCKNA